MIDEEKTLGVNGYRSSELSYGSKKKVFAVCDKCGIGRWVCFFQYHDLCHACAVRKSPSEETKKKLRDSKRGVKNPMFGKKHSAETRKKLSVLRTGTKHTEETKQKMRENGVGMLGRRHSAESRRKNSESHKGKLAGERNPNWKGGNILKICKQCGKEYDVKPSRVVISNFCSNECLAKWQSMNQRGENAPNWMGGISFEPYCPKFSKKFRESVREKHGRVCFLCPTTEEENGRKLSVHHVNYHKNCLCDDVKCEFVPLCMKCHIKTNFDRYFWERLITYSLEFESTNFIETAEKIREIVGGEYKS